MRKIFEQVAEEFDISPEMAEHMWKHKYRMFRLHMQENPGRTILDNRLGKFYVKRRRITFLILAAFTNYRSGRISRETLKDKVTRYLKVRKTLDEYD